MALSILRGITGKVIDLANNVFGVLAIANGGTGASDIATARSNLGLKTASVYDVGIADANVITMDGSTGIGKSGWGRYPLSLGSNFDLNNLNASKNYFTGLYMGNGFTNAPSDSSQWFFIELVCHNASYAMQKAYAFTDNTAACYLRMYVGGSWGSWYIVNSAKVV